MYYNLQRTKLVFYTRIILNKIGQGAGSGGSAYKNVILCTGGIRLLRKYNFDVETSRIDFIHCVF